jgi:hypothetical protein
MKERVTPALLRMAGQTDWLQRRWNRANLLECLRGSLGREKCRFDPSLFSSDFFRLASSVEYPDAEDEHQNIQK